MAASISVGNPKTAADPCQIRSKFRGFVLILQHFNPNRPSTIATSLKWFCSNFGVGRSSQDHNESMAVN